LEIEGGEVKGKSDLRTLCLRFVKRTLASVLASLYNIQIQTKSVVKQKGGGEKQRSASSLRCLSKKRDTGEARGETI